MACRGQGKAAAFVLPARHRGMPASQPARPNGASTPNSPLRSWRRLPLMKCHMLPVATVASPYDGRPLPPPSSHPSTTAASLRLCNSCQVGRTGRRLHVSPNVIAIASTQLVLIEAGSYYTLKKKNINYMDNSLKNWFIFQYLFKIFILNLHFCKLNQS